MQWWESSSSLCRPFCFPWIRLCIFLFLVKFLNFFINFISWVEFIYTHIFCREEFRGVVLTIEKMYRDGRQLVKGGGGSNQLNVKQLRQRIGIKPCLADCLDGLMILHEMHQAEYVMFFCLKSLHRFGIGYSFLYECLAGSNNFVCSSGLWYASVWVLDKISFFCLKSVHGFGYSFLSECLLESKIFVFKWPFIWQNSFKWMLLQYKKGEYEITRSKIVVSINGRSVIAIGTHDLSWYADHLISSIQQCVALSCLE